MKYKDSRIKKEVEPQVGDFIYGNDVIRVIISPDDDKYSAVILNGNYAGNVVRIYSSINDLIEEYKSILPDFELIKSEEMTLIRQ